MTTLGSRGVPLGSDPPRPTGPIADRRAAYGLPDDAVQGSQPWTELEIAARALGLPSDHVDELRQRYAGHENDRTARDWIALISDPDESGTRAIHPAVFGDVAERRR